MQFSAVWWTKLLYIYIYTCILCIKGQYFDACVHCNMITCITAISIMVIYHVKEKRNNMTDQWFWGAYNTFLKVLLAPTWKSLQITSKINETGMLQLVILKYSLDTITGNCMIVEIYIYNKGNAFNYRGMISFSSSC